VNKVVTVNLAGRAWQLEEGAYDSLRAYLDDASARLQANPDRDEILSDFETAIAERCATYVHDHKNVVEAAEMSTIIDAMGPVVDDADQSASSSDATTQLPTAQPTPKRMYRLVDDRVFGGVCSGMAAYFNIDVTVMRLLWVVLTLITSGAMILLYIPLWIFLPEAATPEERAEARGARFDAEGLMRRARVGAPALAGVGAFLSATLRVCATIIWIVLLIAVLVCVGAWVALLWSTIPDGKAFGFTFEHGADPWLLRVWLTCAAWVVIAPLAALTIGARRLSKPAAERSRLSGTWFIAGTALWVAALVSIPMIAWTASKDLRDAIEDEQGVVEFGEYEVCIVDGEWISPGPDDKCPPYVVRIDRG
jgi:phage shock protein PspC (stress-responsive transcriptional regulator)